jgi:hypothetical protein
MLTGAILLVTAVGAAGLWIAVIAIGIALVAVEAHRNRRRRITPETHSHTPVRVRRLADDGHLADPEVTVTTPGSQPLHAVGFASAALARQSSR